MKKFVFFCFLTALLSCAKQGDDERSFPTGRQVTLTASCDDAGSRVMLNSGLKTVWNTGDSVSVFYGSAQNIKATFTGNDGAQSGPITFEAESAIDSGSAPTVETVAAIPYRSENSLEGRVLHASIPKVQYYKKGSYDPASVLLTAVSSTSSLTFRYACAVLCLEVKAGGTLPLPIQSIVLASAAGETLAGGVDVNLQDPAAPAVSAREGGSASITLCAATESVMSTIPAGSSERFYFCVAPVALEGGYTFEVRLSESETILVRNTAVRQLEAATLVGTPCSISPSMSIIIDFSAEFTPAIPTSANNTTVKTFSFTNPTDGKQYSITPYPASDGDGKYYLTTASDDHVEKVKCLRFNSAQSCLLLPGIPGMRLRSIKIQVVTTAQYKPMSIATTKWSDTANVVPRTDFNAGELTSASAFAGADVPLYLYTYSKNTQIARIELYFE